MPLSTSPTATRGSTVAPSWPTTHNITFGPGAFAIRVRNATAQCGAAIATLGWNSGWGQGIFTVDGADGGTLLVEDVSPPGLLATDTIARIKL